ncbi:hypothetical protein AQI88_16285 [Streptomyces cellostaticus]|uniref:Uncharacterized protein n=1 Tax=Streptomyces cellostaticus TaxID=67285 RepID=A0A101NMH0_9ACTN|nr:hypothetical protein AQI88_16285 [Streptomyces cellostaticus]
MRSTASAAEASLRTKTASARGTITSSSVRSVNSRAWSSSSAVALGSSPCSWDSPISWLSSSSVAPWCSSSTGSMPTLRSSLFAAPSKTCTTGPTTFRYAGVEPAGALASRSGTAMARFFGAGSPSTICTTVAPTKASSTEMPLTAASGMPSPDRAGLSSAETDGSAKKPTTRPVTVMPSWAPDSMNDRRSRTFRARAAFLSPASACRARASRSAETQANSWATK